MFVALFALVLIGAYLLPMAVHYDLPIRTCLFKASLFAITRPASTVVLLFTFLVVAFAARTFPLLGLVLTIRTLGSTTAGSPKPRPQTGPPVMLVAPITGQTAQ